MKRFFLMSSPPTMVKMNLLPLIFLFSSLLYQWWSRAELSKKQLSGNKFENTEQYSKFSEGGGGRYMEPYVRVAHFRKKCVPPVKIRAAEGPPPSKLRQNQPVKTGRQNHKPDRAPTIPLCINRRCCRYRSACMSTHSHP